MNACKCRDAEQAKGAVRLGPKGEWVVRSSFHMGDADSIPTGRESGPKVFDVGYVERGAPCHRPSGRLTVRQADEGMGSRERKKRMLSCNGVDTG